MIASNQDAQVLYSAQTFRLLLDTLARPGKISQLGYPQFLGTVPSYSTQSANGEQGINFYALGALLTLLDRETSFIIGANGQWLAAENDVVRWTLLRSSTNYAEAGEAAFALLCDSGSGALVRHLNMGTLLEPEMSATVFYCVEMIAEAGQDARDQASGATLELRGPGIEESRRVYVSGPQRADWDAMLATRRGYPLGIDSYLIDRDGRCIGLPRTTKIGFVDHDN
jgi:alpha-D-ribose 1-methylphosphonate 5-triphosphate synthase subunit PhnH